jgi:hypothetical protein
MTPPPKPEPSFYDLGNYEPQRTTAFPDYSYTCTIWTGSVVVPKTSYPEELELVRCGQTALPIRRRGESFLGTATCQRHATPELWAALIDPGPPADLEGSARPGYEWADETYRPVLYSSRPRRA